ncbi:MAG: AAA family ATPase [Candidatus Eisenbacteria bacterium]|nr:AAA family ATPase [Candidatus Eisenbacteria bacterium]
MKRDGSNLASVLSVMAKENREGFNRVIAFLSKVVPGIQDIEVKHVGRKETIEFRQLVGNSKDAWRFVAENMSDGTLRALGVLTALFQSSNGTRKKVPFVGIEEPGAVLHPTATHVIRDGLVIASKTNQVAVTNDSPDLLDDKGILDESILVIVNRSGETRIALLNQAGQSAIRGHVHTAGELLRLNQIEPDEVL